MTEQARLLTDSGNFAVVQLPGRNAPGVVFQGDSLFSLIGQLQDTLRAAEEGDLSDTKAELSEVLLLLAQIKRDYEAVCLREGIQLPYVAV